jgi:hypothetical protein
MKARVIHSSDGAIAGVITFSPDAPPPLVSLEPGLALTEMDVPEDLLDLASPRTEQEIGEALEALRVEVKTSAVVRRIEGADPTGAPRHAGPRDTDRDES